MPRPAKTTTSAVHGPNSRLPTPDRREGPVRLRLVGVTLAAFALGVLLASAAAAQRPVMIFDFDSGGASHPEGFGAWHVHVDGLRANITHTVRDDVTTFPAATLTDDEHARLWRLVEAIERTPRDAVVTRPSPGQPAMTFTVTRDARTTRLSVSAASTDIASGVADLLHFLTELIHRRTGQRPVMG